MTFAFGWGLLALAALPLLVLAYRRRVAAQDARRERLAASGLVAGGPSGTPPRRRHLAPALLLAALAVLAVALARPQAEVAEPRREGTVVLAFDVSGSMAATDLAPSRMDAARAAARTFVERQPPQVRIGVVAFSSTGVVTQQPTLDRGAVLAALDRLEPGGATALARGLQASLSAIAGRSVTVDDDDAGGPEPRSSDPALGYYADSAVVLLSDGENTDRADPVAVADLASTAGVEVHAVGLGSAAGTTLEIDGFQVATRLDAALLREIARTTDGRYHDAADAAALEEVYDSIDLAWTVRTTRSELTGLLAGVAALLLVAAAAVSLARTGRVV